MQRRASLRKHAGGVDGVIGDGIAAGVTVAGAGVIIVAGGGMASACPITDMDIIIRGIITAVITAMAVVGAIAIIAIGAGVITTATIVTGATIAAGAKRLAPGSYRRDA